MALDPDVRLWRFLSLSPCAAAACQMIISRSHGPWLKCLWESSAITDVAPLRHPSVEDVLVQILKGDAEENADDRHLDVVCSLLSRIFSKSPESIRRSDKAMRERLEAAAQYERLVAELPLWGFDGPVVNSFIRRGIADERRKLLNTLFLSANIFVQGVQH